MTEEQLSELIDRCRGLSPGSEVIVSVSELVEVVRLLRSGRQEAREYAACSLGEDCYKAASGIGEALGIDVDK